MNLDLPKFVIVRNSQKRTEDFSQTFSGEMLSDIALKITGQSSFEIEFDESDYNKGRLAKLFYNDSVYYVIISPVNSADGRNYWFQTVPSALTQFYNESKKSKGFYYYINNVVGNISTDYFNFMYRLMRTAGVIFLNDKEVFKNAIQPYYTVQDMIISKEKLRGKSKTNNSSYVTMDEDGVVQIFAKTYGANKKESSLICFAISQIHTGGVILYQISEGNLNVLPQPDIDAISKLMTVRVVLSDIRIEKEEFVKNDSLRSPTFIYNLLDKLGQKKCEFCDCSIPQVIQAAHIWPVSEIKKSLWSDEDKLTHAMHRDNGLWLCENHHKLLDRNIIVLSSHGELLVKKALDSTHYDYLSDVTKHIKILEKTKSGDFLTYLSLRNAKIKLSDYKNI